MVVSCSAGMWAFIEFSCVGCNEGKVPRTSRILRGARRAILENLAVRGQKAYSFCGRSPAHLPVPARAGEHAGNLVTKALARRGGTNGQADHLLCRRHVER